mmetsp:Transcript_4034/g.7177  ORF Transcript_4034/g.7177 Transcript_4034/m.7177 type:complete len:687 (-) Transcript_4034:26-2086(-)
MADSCTHSDVHDIFDSIHGSCVVNDVLAALGPQAAFQYLLNMEKEQEHRHLPVQDLAQDPEAFIQDAEYDDECPPTEATAFAIWEARRRGQSFGVLPSTAALQARVLDEVLLTQAALVADVVGVFAATWEGLRQRDPFFEPPGAEGPKGLVAEPILYPPRNSSLAASCLPPEPTFQPTGATPDVPPEHLDSVGTSCGSATASTSPTSEFTDAAPVAHPNPYATDTIKSPILKPLMLCTELLPVMKLEHEEHARRQALSQTEARTWAALGRRCRPTQVQLKMVYMAQGPLGKALHREAGHQDWETPEALLHRLTGQQHHMPCAMLLQFLGSIAECTAEETARLHALRGAQALPQRRRQGSGRGKKEKGKAVSLAQFRSSSPAQAHGTAVLRDQDPLFSSLKCQAEQCMQQCASSEPLAVLVPEGFEVAPGGLVDPTIAFRSTASPEELRQLQQSLSAELEHLSNSHDYSLRRSKLGLYNPQLVMYPQHLTPLFRRYAHVAAHRHQWSALLADAQTPDQAWGVLRRILTCVCHRPPSEEQSSVFAVDTLLQRIQPMLLKRSTTGLAACIWDFVLSPSWASTSAPNPLGLPLDVLLLMTLFLPPSVLLTVSRVCMAWYQIVDSDETLSTAVGQWRKQCAQARKKGQAPEPWTDVYRTLDVDECLKGKVRADRKQLSYQATAQARYWSWI